MGISPRAESYVSARLVSRVLLWKVLKGKYLEPFVHVKISLSLVPLTALNRFKYGVRVLSTAIAV